MLNKTFFWYFILSFFLQVMALIAYLMEFKGNYGPHLIIVPNAVLVNWKVSKIILTIWHLQVRAYSYHGNGK